MKGRLLIASLLALLLETNASYAETASAADVPVISIKASRFLYQPNKIVLKKGQTVVLEIESLDRLHGFAIPELGVRAEATPGQKIRLSITPTKTGSFMFYCDIFCGSGHEEMAGAIIVES
ncbi:cytochrome c oxidase subunit II [Candidatus Methylospira mobilis]|uniref:Cytochrome c oxidase subunit II n=1 Tax=Candidatus Methylospira mobilis TaxID=1808979 RepID=A0A5Q0BHX0_9GAMM|nr:cupredoxin domain-containing protein [Candidatus Methylospira mobilis]QFY41754.1 cytochrome c oxidase subunit II [Candidatus Methylospira mobilis]